jgi:nicotinamidase-related amidase
MDMQNGIVERYAQSDSVVQTLREAISVARRASIQVIFVRLGFRNGAPEVSDRNRIFSALIKNFDMAEGSRATQVHSDIEPQDGDVVVTKKRVSAFTGSDLEVILRSREVSELVLSGIATSGVVLSTLRQAADLDYRITVLSDGCTDADDEVHKVLTEKVFPRQANVITAAEWAAELLKR